MIGYTPSALTQGQWYPPGGGRCSRGSTAPTHRQRMKTHHKRMSVAGEDTEDLRTPLWCPLCREHTHTNHFDNRNAHKAGVQFGWVGRLLALEQVCERVADWYTGTPGEPIPALEHLMEVIHGERPSNNGD